MRKVTREDIVGHVFTGFLRYNGDADDEDFLEFCEIAFELDHRDTIKLPPFYGDGEFEFVANASNWHSLEPMYTAEDCIGETIREVFFYPQGNEVVFLLENGWYIAHELEEGGSRLSSYHPSEEWFPFKPKTFRPYFSQ